MKKLWITMLICVLLLGCGESGLLGDSSNPSYELEVIRQNNDNVFIGEFSNTGDCTLYDVFIVITIGERVLFGVTETEDVKSGETVNFYVSGIDGGDNIVNSMKFRVYYDLE